MVDYKPMSENIPENKSETGKLYELGFHLVPTLSEEEVQKEFNGLKDFITKNGGTCTSESAPQILKLQYTMVKNIDSKNHKYETAYFGWVKFTAEAETATELEDHLKTELSVLRYILVKTIAEANVTAEAIANLVNDKEKGNATQSEDDSDDDSNDAETDSESNDDTEEVADESSEKSSDDDATDEVDKAIDDLVDENK